MKRVLISLVLIVLVIGLVVAGCAKPAPTPTPTPAPTPTPTPTPAPTPAPVEPIKLVVGLTSAPYHVAYKAIFKPWADELEQLTEGKVKVTIHHSGALGPMNETYEGVSKGVFDITSVLPAIQGGRFPLQDVTHIPYLLELDAKDKNGKLIRETLMEKFLIPVHFKQEEVKVMWTGRYLPKDLLLHEKLVKTLDDAKGMLIGYPGGKMAADIIRVAFGASAETLMVSDMYLSMERGLVGASFITPEILLGLKVWEVTKYISDCGSLSPGDVSLWVMNAETWASLPPDIQKIIDELSPKYRDITVTSWVAEEAAAVEFSKGKGIVVFDLAAVCEPLWKERVKNIADEWAKEMDGRGLPGTEIVAEMRRLAAESQ